MPVSKIKNLIILILLLAVGFLLALVLPKKAAQSRQQQAERTALCELFSANGIALSEDILPEEQNLYTLELGEAQTCADGIAAALFENPVCVQDSTSREQCSYLDENGTLRYDSTGSISVRIREAEELSDLQSGTEKFLRTLSYAASTVSEPARVSAGVFSVSCTQRLYEVPVFSEPLVLTYTNNCLTQMDGKFFTQTDAAVRVDDTLCISCADALVVLLSQRDTIGWVGSSILSVTQGYRQTDTAAAAIRVVPCWKIVTDAGAFYVNGITSEITVAEDA